MRLNELQDLGRVNMHLRLMKSGMYHVIFHELKLNSSDAVKGKGCCPFTTFDKVSLGSQNLMLYISDTVNLQSAYLPCLLPGCRLTWLITSLWNTLPASVVRMQ